MTFADAGVCDCSKQIQDTQNIVIQEIHSVDDKVNNQFMNITRTLEVYKVEIRVATENAISKQITRIILTILGIFTASIFTFLLFMSIIVTRYFKVERKNLNESNKHKRSRKSNRPTNKD